MLCLPLVPGLVLLTVVLVLGKEKKPNFCSKVPSLPLWCILLEHNSCIFEENSLDEQLLWDKIRCLASTWCNVHGLFREAPYQICLEIG